MPTFKRGDRVRAEYDAVVGFDRINSATGRILVKPVDGSFVSYVNPPHMTLIAPAVKVGDPVTREVFDTLPHGSVIIAKLGAIAQVAVGTYSDSRVWRTPGGANVGWGVVSGWSATVLHVGNDK